MRLSKELMDRHLQFSDRSKVPYPLCDFFVGGLFPLAEFQDGLRTGLLEPGMLVPQAFEEFYRKSGSLIPARGELVPTVFPFLPIPWMEAIVGCPIRVSLETFSIGTQPFLTDLSNLDVVEAAILDPQNSWLLKLLEYQRFLVEMFGEDLPVGLPIMRGPVDLATAMLGGARLVFEFYDHPQEVERLLRICADAWIQTARAQIAVIPPFQGGYFNYRQTYFAEPAPVLQEDNVALLSPKLYRQFVLPQDKRILDEFPGALFHTHSSAAHILLDGLLTCASLRTIDSCWDLPPFGPRVESLLPGYQKIQESGKSLYIVAVGCPQEKDLYLLRELSPQGLCILFEATDQASGHRIADQLEAMWQQAPLF